MAGKYELNKIELNELKKCREALDKAIKTKIGSTHNKGQAFTVSSAGQDGFKLILILKIQFAGLLSFIDGFNREYGITSDVTADHKTVVFDFGIWVKKQPAVMKSLNEENGIEEKTQTTPSASKADKAKIRYETLLNGIREVLKEVPDLNLDKPYVLRTYPSNDKIAAIRMTNPFKRNESLYLLERAGYHLVINGEDVLCSRQEDVIEDLDVYQRAKTPIRLCKNWMDSLRKWIEKNQVKARIKTHPLAVVFTNYGQTVEVSVDASATPLLKCLEKNKIKANQAGRIVTFKVNQQITATPFLDAPLVQGEERGLVKPTGSIPNEHGTMGHTSTNYREFEFLPFNRKPADHHVNYIRKLIEEEGNITLITVIETDCVDGTLRKWIVDGQHRFKALEMLKMPIEYCLIRANSKEQIVRIIAMLNNSGRRWSTNDYLNAWVSLDIPLYISIKKWSDKKFGFSLILEAFSGLDSGIAMELFKTGTFNPDAEFYEEGLVLLEKIERIKAYLPKSMKIQRGLLRFLKKQKDFKEDLMIKKLKAHKTTLPFGATDTLAETSGKFAGLYAAAA